MDAALIRQVWRRADGRCEYCQLSQEFDDRPFEIDHIRSRKHLGPPSQVILPSVAFVAIHSKVQILADVIPKPAN